MRKGKRNYVLYLNNHNFGFRENFDKNPCRGAHNMLKIHNMQKLMILKFSGGQNL